MRTRGLVIGLLLLTGLFAIAAAGAGAPARSGKLLVCSNRANPANRDVSGRDVYVLNADGTGIRRLTNALGEDCNARWSPDGKRIVFTSHRDHPVPGFGNGEIYVMKADGSGETRLTANEVDDRNPTWSPDGKKIAFWRGLDLYVMNADGTGAMLLTTVPLAIWGRPVWSPDGRGIAYAREVDGNLDILVSVDQMSDLLFGGPPTSGRSTGDPFPPRAAARSSVPRGTTSSSARATPT